MRNRNITLGVILISIGIIWVLINLKVLDWSIFNSLVDLWPLILVVVGIFVIFHNKPVVTSVVWLLFLAVIVGYSFYSRSAGVPGKNEVSGKTSVEKALETKYAKLEFDAGGIKLNVDSGTDKLVDVETNDPDVKYSERYSNGKEKAVITYSTKSRPKISFKIGNFTLNEYNYDLRLNKDVIWDMEMDLGIVSGTIDMRELKVRDFDLEVGAGSLQLLFGSGYESAKAKIESGLSDIRLVLPEDAGVRIKVSGLVNKENLDSMGWVRNGNFYTSPGYEQASKKIDIDIKMGTGKLSVTVQRDERI